MPMEFKPYIHSTTSITRPLLRRNLQQVKKIIPFPQYANYLEFVNRTKYYFPIRYC